MEQHSVRDSSEFGSINCDIVTIGQFECEGESHGESSSNTLRGQICQLSRKSPNVQKSLQTFSLKNNKDVLKRHIKTFEQTKLHESFVNHLKGTSARVKRAQVPTASGQEVVQSYVSFPEAFSLYLSYDPNSLPATLKQQHFKQRFRELLCHPNDGLCAYIVKCKDGEEFVILRSDDVDLEFVFEDMQELPSNPQEKTPTSHLIKSMYRAF